VPTDHDGPKPLAWSLQRLARGVRRVDLAGFGAVEGAWPEIHAAAASGARPVRLANGELVVGVATGSHAARARRDANEMLEQLRGALDDAPTSIRVVVRP
jgi:Dna[CI] antecedent, DciA